MSHLFQLGFIHKIWLYIAWNEFMLYRRKLSPPDVADSEKKQTKFLERIKTSFRTLIKFITVKHGASMISDAAPVCLTSYKNASINIFWAPFFSKSRMATQTEFLILKAPLLSQPNQFADVIVPDVILILSVFFSSFRSLFYPFMAALQTRFEIF